MDNQWHQQHHHHQAVQGNNICPICSNFHYPFCPPHPSMNQNPRFLPPQDPSFRGPMHVSEPYRLPLDPYRHPPVGGGYRDPMLLHNTNKHPGLDRHSHGYGAYNGDVALPYNYSNGGGKDFDIGGDRNVKRMRVGETDSGAGVNDFRVNSSRVMSEEDERRLSLIRNHGGASSGSSPNGGNFMPGTIAGFNGYRESRVSDTFNMPAMMGMSDYRDPGFGSGEGRVPSLHPKKSHNYREEHSLSYGHQPIQSNQHMTTPEGISKNNPQIPQQGPHVFPERNGFKSNSPYNEQRTTIPSNNLAYNDQPLGPHHIQKSMHNEYDFQSPSILNDIRPSSQVKFPSLEGNHLPYYNNYHGNYMPMISGQPPLPHSPPPPLPVDPPYDTSFELKAAYKPNSSPHYLQNKAHFSGSTGVVPEHYLGEGQLFPLQPRPAAKTKAIDASHLLKQPHRATRPGHIVIILRGLPGSGKSYLAKMFRDLEVENGGSAPRIHSIDDYFMTENEKVDECELENSTGSGRAKKKTMKKVMEYCYEPEMEEAYRASMLKAFKKTLEEGVFTFVIVDDRNLRVADFAQFWAIAKRSGYEVYLLEAAYKDPAGCAARNVHGFTLDDIQKMSKLWEEAPSWYLQMDVKSLLHGDDLKDGDIQEVDMDTEDRDLDVTPSGPVVVKHDNAEVTATGDHATGSLQDEERSDGAEGNHPREQIKELGKSKWSADFDEDDADRIQGNQRKKNSLSGLIKAYAKDGKSVQWSDQAGNTGFTIGGAKKANVLSLVIGPGAGYNLTSNPLPEVNPASTLNTGEKHSIFQQQLRAERESFKAIFDRRGHRIALDLEEE